MPTAQDNVNKLTITVCRCLYKHSDIIHALFGVKKRIASDMRSGTQTRKSITSNILGAPSFQQSAKTSVNQSNADMAVLLPFLFKLGRKRFFEFLFVCDLFSDGLSAPNTKMPDSKKYIIV